jgi:hypothetical protein
MSKLLAKLFNINADVELIGKTNDDVLTEVTVLQPHELSYTGGGGIPDIIQ